MYNKIKPALEDRKLDKKNKVNIFNAIISNVFLCNSEIRTTTEDMEEGIDTCQKTN